MTNGQILSNSNWKGTKLDEIHRFLGNHRRILCLLNVLPNVGPKTAAKWIQKYGSIANLLEHVDEVKGRHNATLKENKELLLLCKKLVTIDCGVPISTDFDSFDLQEFDRDKLREVFTELGFNQLIISMGLDEEI